MSGNKEFTEQHQKTLKDHLRGCCDLGNRPELIERCEQIAGNCKGPNPNLCNNNNGNCDDKPKDNNCGGCPPAQEETKQDCDSCTEQQKNNKAKCPAPFPKK